MTRHNKTNTTARPVTAEQHDNELIERARKLSFYDEGWEALKDECLTEQARNEIDRIERLKYRRAECDRDMD